MHLIFVHMLPNEKKGRYIHYKHRKKIKEGWESCDIKQYINNNQDQWLNDIEKWHSFLSKNALKHFRWWWLLPASRLIAWYPPVFISFFFTIALIEFCENSQDDELYVVDCPIDVMYYVKELRPEYIITASEELQYNNRLNLKNFLSNRLGMCLNYARAVTFLFNTFFKGFIYRNKVTSDDISLIIFSYLLDINRLINHGDHFFGEIFNEISFMEQKNILWIYYDQSKTNKFEEVIHKYMKSNNKNFLLLFNMLKFSDIMRILLMLVKFTFRLKRIKKGIPSLRVAQYQSHSITEKIFNDHIKNYLPYIELSIYFSFKNFFKNFNNFHMLTIMYPYEEKGIERAILYACKESRNKIKTIGFAHAIYNKGLLYLRNRIDVLENLPKPDIIATPGPSIEKWFIDWAKIHPENLKTIGSPRYRPRLSLREEFNKHSDKLRVLIIISQGDEVGSLANYLEEREDLFDNCELLIRPYPYAWDDEQEQGFCRIKKILCNIRIESGSLLDQIAWCDAGIYCSTSAAIELMLCGRLSIYMDMNEIFILDPMIGKGDFSKIYRCFNPNQLKEILNQIRHMSRNEYNEKVENQYEFAANIYSPIDEKKLQEVITVY